jgi:hypothetical protein
MKKSPLLLLLSVCTSILSTHSDYAVAVQQQDSVLLHTATKNLFEKSSLFLSSTDIDVLLSGRIRYETFNFTSPLVFRSDYFDKYTFQRAKFNIDVESNFGRRTYGESAVTARIRMTAFNVIDNYDVYTPIVLEPIAFHSKNYIRKSELGEHHHDSTVTFAYLEDGYVDIKLEKFLPLSTKTAFRIGYFPFLVGRGIVLGDYYGGAVDMLGWKEEGDVGNTTQRSPGCTITYGDPEQYALQAYYSKWKSRSHGPDHTRKELRARRLDREEFLNDPIAIQRGYSADRDLFALRGLISFNSGADGFSVYMEPYVVYVNAPELKVEFEGDASARLGTAGCMLDWRYNGWRINAEVGLQFGRQTMHPIDRNHVVIDDAYYSETATEYGAGDVGAVPQNSVTSGRLDITRGTPAAYHSHVMLGITATDPSSADYVHSGEFLPYRAYYVSDELNHINAQRSLDQQGAMIRRGAPTSSTDTHIAGTIHQSKKLDTDNATVPGNDSLYSPYTFKSGIAYYDDLFTVQPHGVLFNAHIPFGGATRFRDAYTLDFHGAIALLDVSYTFPSQKLTFAGALGYISGDDNPFNTEVDKRYNGFVPLRDANYEGHSVKSYAVLAARKIARPSNFSERLLYAQNNFESSTNLQYFGLGAVIRPLADKNELMLETNLLYFWEDVAPFIWNKKAERDFDSDVLNGIWSKLQEDLHFSGYQTTIRASQQLGLECNAVLTWRPIPTIELRALFATFVPGKLYRDIDGTPNAYAIRLDADGDVHLESLGDTVPFGGMVRLTYFF